MSDFNKFWLTILIFYSFAIYADCLSPPPRCEFLYPIPKDEIQPTYGYDVDTEDCLVFQNRVHFEQENCKRQSSRQKSLVESCKKDCCKCLPKLPICTKIYGPVCAGTKYKQTTYGNLCQYTNDVCRRTGYEANNYNGPFYFFRGECSYASNGPEITDS